MSNLRNDIIDFLITVPILHTVAGRRAVVQRSGLDAKASSQLELDGRLFDAVSSIVGILYDYGALTDGRNALEALLGTIGENIGEDRKQALDVLIRQYRQRPVFVISDDLRSYLTHIVATWRNVASPLLPESIRLSEIAPRLRVVDTGRHVGDAGEPHVPGYRKQTLSGHMIHGTWLLELLSGRADIEKWLILGDPGTGKTMLLLNEAATLAADALNEQRPPIPAWLPLAPFAAQAEQVFGYSLYDHLTALGRNLAIPRLGEEFQQLARKGQAVLFCDGLDEVPSGLQGQLVQRIEGVIAPGVGNRIIYTSRRVGLVGPTGYSIVELERFTVAEQRALMIAICGEEKAALLLRNIAGQRDLQDMAGVPMALTVLALVAKETGDNLPDYLHRRTDLYRSAIRLLLEGRHRSNQSVRNPEAAEPILARTSLELHGTFDEMDGTAGETFAASQLENAVRAAGTWPSDWQGPRDFIQDVSSKSGIVYPIDTLNRNYRYLHRTIREFLAALELSGFTPERRRQFVESRLRERTWAEVFVLLGGLTPDVEEYLNQLLSGPTDLALRALKEIKQLDPQLATQILQLEPGQARERRQVFGELGRKLAPADVVEVLRAYLQALGPRVPRVDLYFIQEMLERIRLPIADDLREDLLDHLPDVPAAMFPDLDRQGAGVSYWCDVPGGACSVGADPLDPAKPDWVPELSEVIVSSFQIGRVPVTNGQYELFDPAHKAKRDFVDEVLPEELAQHPVVRVSWYEASIFCQWLSQTHPGVRLPTEAEWEKAASWTRDGKKLRFPWGNDFDPSLLNSWHQGPNRTTTVGSYPHGQSPCGALDMAGNVWEWCSDWFDEDVESSFRQLRASPRDPAGPPTGSRRIDRGGGWYQDVGLPYTFLRAADEPSDEFSHCGFRLVRST